MKSFLRTILIIEILKNVSTAASQSNNFYSNPNVLMAIDIFKRLEPKLQNSDIKTITVVSILKGILQTEENMEENIIKCIKDMLNDSKIWNIDHFTRYTSKINRQILKDKRSLELLINSLDVILGVKTSKEFLMKMQEIIMPQTNSIDNDYLADNEFEKGVEVQNKSIFFSNKIKNLEENVMHNIKLMRRMSEDHLQTALNHLMKEPDEINRTLSLQTPQEVKFLNSNKDNPNNNTELLEISSHNDEKGNADSANKNVTYVEKDENKAKQEEGSLETFGNEDSMGGGGLVGLISNLSGGEGGSDIGALIGALTGVISNLLGPNGIDIESLIGTATSLISGLLTGNKNFGTVLGVYVGTALDGFSGGGGAINNGQFLGNLLGTVLAYLSANPEDDGEGIKPFIFLQNFIHSFVEAKNRPTEEEDVEETRNIVMKENDIMEDNGDSGYFINNFVSSVTNHIVSIFLKGFFGASAGASQASANSFHK